MTKKLKIAIVVHGRFHAFDLARALLRRGHNVTLLTNYPKWAVKRFDFPVERVRSFWQHGVLTRTANKIDPHKRLVNQESWFHPMFGRWIAQELATETWDVVHTWSGVSEELLSTLNGKATLKMIMRGSAHIRTQARLLAEEEFRTGISQDQPSEWMITREQREYELADTIVTLSTFAKQSFVAEGVDAAKLSLLPLGSSLKSFRPLPEVVEERCQRILSGQPLRVLYVGAVSFRKGLYDIAAILEVLGKRSAYGSRFDFTFIGPVANEAIQSLAKLKQSANFLPKHPQWELPRWYAKGDVFIFPTIEDGYAVVLAQANTNGLPVLTTTNCGGPDLIRDNETGWILPIRAPQAFIDRLLWCDAYREELADMVRHNYQTCQPRDWDDVAADFETVCLKRLAQLR
jgi:glycosyltransferase involved in cell wall biosynthesis